MKAGAQNPGLFSRNPLMPANQYRVLFFIVGATPSKEQRSEALNFGPHVGFRNTHYVDVNEPCEDCNAVYGEVPRNYAAKFPWACSIVDFYNGKLDTAPMASEKPADGEVEAGVVEVAEFDPFTPADAARGADWKPQG